MNSEMLGKILVSVGVLFIIFGLIFWLGKGLGLGRLPGDIVIKTKNTSIYIPIVTGLIISIILSIILNLIIRKW